MEKPGRREKRAVVAFMIVLALVWVMVELFSGSFSNESPVKVMSVDSAVVHTRFPLDTSTTLINSDKGPKRKRREVATKDSAVSKQKTKTNKVKKKQQSVAPTPLSPLEKPVRQNDR